LLQRSVDPFALQKIPFGLSLSKPCPELAEVACPELAEVACPELAEAASLRYAQRFDELSADPLIRSG
jgi:hypothetical protein